MSGDGRPLIRDFLRGAGVFSLGFALLYLGLYVASERLVHRYAQTNKFFLAGPAADAPYDLLVLGASHAAVLGYQDMPQRLTEMTSKRAINLAIVGGGVHVARVMYDYFLARHRADTLIYVIDSFTFYSRQWNEDRLSDSRLFVRAPFDPTLALVSFRRPRNHAAAWDYTLGFSKINSPGRFDPDITAEESVRFTRTYRPVPQLDDERLAYLFPPTIDAAVMSRYLGALERLLSDAAGRGLRLIVVKLPLPERIAARLPDEAAFDTGLDAVLRRAGTSLHDFTHSGNEERFFYDTDHLNRAGVEQFFERSLAPLLASVPATR